MSFTIHIAFTVTSDITGVTRRFGRFRKMASISIKSLLRALVEPAHVRRNHVSLRFQGNEPLRRLRMRARMTRSAY
jgi:hypothetical protein